jgi:hypothetical protein
MGSREWEVGAAPVCVGRMSRVQPIYDNATLQMDTTYPEVRFTLRCRTSLITSLSSSWAGLSTWLASLASLDKQHSPVFPVYPVGRRSSWAIHPVHT